MNKKNTLCPICKSQHIDIWSKAKDLEYLTSDKEYTYYKCLNCTTIFISEFLVLKLNEIYPSNYYSFLKKEKNIAVSIKEYFDKIYFKKILKRYDNKPINILDIGGGSGWIMDIIKSIYSNVIISQVIDIDENAKIIAEKKGHQFFHGPIEAFDSDTQFDLVLMLNLIEHISNPKETLIKIEKLLNTNGLVLLKTPNIESLDANLYKNKYWGGLHCPRHWILFSEKSFRKMVGKTKLNIAKIKYTQGAPFWTWSVLINWKKKGWVKITKEKPVVFHPMTPFLQIFFASIDFIRGFFGFKTSQMFIELEKK